MLIKRVNTTSFDVFWHTGWDYWARFHREHDGSLKHINGKQMPTKLFQQFRAIINKKGKGRQVEAAARELNKQFVAASNQAVANLVSRLT